MTVTSTSSNISTMTEEQSDGQSCTGVLVCGTSRKSAVALLLSNWLVNSTTLLKEIDMTTEQTITIHHEPPPHTMDGYKVIIAWSILNKDWFPHTVDMVKNCWGKHYSAWYDPRVGEPVKPRRFVVEDEGPHPLPYTITDTQAVKPLRGVAFKIPTREAAQAIADIYERAAEGGEV